MLASHPRSVEDAATIMADYGRGMDLLLQQPTINLNATQHEDP